MDPTNYGTSAALAAGGLTLTAVTAAGWPANTVVRFLLAWLAASLVFAAGWTAGQTMRDET